ncbi:MAG: Coenzyme F420 hydrogenase/dehydrogenase, beta subunit C-terminal domain [Syntrophorhabdales bacterium]|jgi:coenzyme F420 hydrogenase subunit beta
MKILGAKELVADVQSTGLCIGCGACVDLCPYFRNHRGKTVQLFPCTLSQGRCYASCPKAEVDLGELARIYWHQPYRGQPVGKYDQALAAKAGAKMPSGAYQGGGAVSALLTQAMNQGLIDAAVLTGQNENGPFPVVAEDPEGIVSCASSKFSAAPTLAALNRATAAGRRNLGVVGTPCQVTAVAKIRCNPLRHDEFGDSVSLVIGLFCNWSLDQRALRTYLGRMVDLSRIKGTDIPPPPAKIMRLDLGDEILEIPLDEVRPFIPATCRLCPDMTSEWADISVGMFEGRPGWNTLLVRTAKGQKLVNDTVASGLLLTEPMPAANLEHLKEAAAGKKRRAFQAVRQRGLLNPSAQDAQAMLRVPPDVLKEIIDEEDGGSHV